MRGFGFVSQQPTSEDCLYLNVWTPGADSSQRPVMVWIHGGGFVFGSGAAPLYDGSTFSRDDVVLVTINYRLHALGLLFLDELFPQMGNTGNISLRDQIAALKWVRANISRFGGDPQNVTIFGESAGGAFVAALLGMPESDGLFQRAIVQSGSAQHVLPPETATKVAVKTLRAAGVSPRDPRALTRVPTSRLTRAAVVTTAMARGILGEHRHLRFAYLPVTGDASLPSRPVDLVAAGSARDVDIIVGSNADEARVIYTFNRWLRTMLPTPKPDLRSYFSPNGRTKREVLATYASSRGTGRTDLDLAIEGDHLFTIPAIRLAEAQGHAHGRAWMYRFVWRSPANGGLLGAAHGLDVPFVFDVPEPGPMWGTTPSRTLAQTMHDSWVRFARTGDPSGGSLGSWPRYDVQTRAVMHFGENNEVIEDPLGEERELWSGAW